ncbi:lyase family protein [Enterococcus bulliens]
MYINEVLANRGLEYLGHHKGEYQFLDPLDDVNRSQSTNDVYPSSGKIAVYLYMMELDTVLETLIEAFHKKSQEYATAQKMGRTQLQDAVPTTFGTTFSAFATSLLRCQKRLYASRKEITRLNLGGTAIGTGVNASPIYQQAVYEELNQLLPFTVYPADHLVDATQHIDQFVQISSSLKALAVALSKIAHDLRLMASGPRSGLGEIQLPKRQAGSSIMPGKVNPVIPEVVQQVAFQVMGSDLTITLAAQSGELELNPFEPILFHHLFLSLKSLTQVCHVFQTKCVEGIIVNETHCQQQVEQGVSLATRLTPLIGYQKASELVSKALQENQPIETFLSEEVILKLQKAHN